MPSPGQASRSGKISSNLSQSNSPLSPKCSASSFGDSALSGGLNDTSRHFFSDVINRHSSFYESMLPKPSARTVRNVPPTASMTLFNDAFLNSLSMKDFPKHPNPTEFAFNSVPLAPSFSSVPAAYDYINPMIRNVNAPGSAIPLLNEASSTTSSSKKTNKSRETPPPMPRVARFSDQENVAPAASQVADLSQYINPEIHSAHPAFRNPSGFVKNCRKEPRADTFKTVMCQAWLESTYCAFGAECKFAHGEAELRPAALPIRNSQKYKTKLCDKYTTTGICPYGRRCLFIHPDPVSSEAYRRRAVAQTLVQNTIGVPLKSTAPAPPSTPATTAPTTTTSPDTTDSESGVTTPLPSRPHPSWPLESSLFFNRPPSRPWRDIVLSVGQSAENSKEQNAALPSFQENQHDTIRMAARAAAAAAHQTGATLGMTEDDLADHLALQLIQLQRTQSSSSAFGHLVDEQASRLHQTHSLPNSRHSSISPYSNGSTGSTSGIWSNTQSPEEVFDNVFYHEENDHQTPKLSAPSIIRRPKKSTTPVDSDEVSVEMSTPSADMFNNLTRTLNL